MRLLLALLLLVGTSFPALAAHKNVEAWYQNIDCNRLSGEQEYITYGEVRVDCLLKDQAIEYDFAKKWYEGVSQALYYGQLTDRRAVLVLIMEQPKDLLYIVRAESMIAHYNLPISLFVVDWNGDRINP